MQRIARWIYGAALAACPRRFRRRFGARMRDDFDRLLAEQRGGGVWLALRESADVIGSAWRDSGARLGKPGRRGNVRASSGVRRRSAGNARRAAQFARDDARFALRALAARPGYTAISVLTLALGIGAATIVFSVVDNVVIRPLPYADDARIAWLFSDDLTRERPSRMPSTPGDFLDWRARSTSFEQMVASRSRGAVLTGGLHPERIAVHEVSDGSFEMLGVPAALGRTFTLESTADEVVLSHGTWQQVFGGDPDVVGGTARLDGVGHRIVGVMPAGFRHPASSSAAMWRPLRFAPEDAGNRSGRSLMILAKLDEGVTLQQALDEMNGLAAGIAEDHPETNESWGVHMLALKDIYLEDSLRMYGILAASVVLVLLIASVNLAGLVLARGAARRAELSVRLALGASRGRIVRLLLAEGGMVAAAGLLAGMALAVVGLDLIMPLAPSWPLVLRETTITPRSFAFSIVAAGLSLIAFGVLPALGLSRQSLRSALGAGAQRSGRTAADLRLRRVLVVAQMSVAVILMVGAVLLVRSVVNIVNADSGFDYRGVVAARVLADIDDGDAGAYFDEVRQRVAALPGVDDVALVDSAPMDGTGDWVRVFIDGERMQEERALGADYRRVTASYFDTLSIARIAGRLFTEADGIGERVAVINRDFAERFLTGREPLGALISLAPSSGSDTDQRTEWRVIGVVETVQEWGPTSFETPMVYVPFATDPRASMSLLLRTEADPEALIGPLRDLVREVGDSPVDRVRTLASYFHETYEAQRFMLVLLGGFASLAALLAGIGLYGVMAYNVVQRRHEIGVRAALGARREELSRMIVRQGATLAVVAVLVGIAGAVPIARTMSLAWMGRMLVGIDWFDPLTFAGVALFVLVTALLASWLPARRAARIDPVTALRSEI